MSSNFLNPLSGCRVHTLLRLSRGLLDMTGRVMQPSFRCEIDASLVRISYAIILRVPIDPCMWDKYDGKAVDDYDDCPLSPALPIPISTTYASLPSLLISSTTSPTFWNSCHERSEESGRNVSGSGSTNRTRRASHCMALMFATNSSMFSRSPVP